MSQQREFVNTEELFKIIQDVKLEKIPPHRRASVWQIIAEKYECQAEDKKSVKQLQKAWENLKRRSKESHSKRKKELRKTGGGDHPKEIDDLEEKVLDEISHNVELRSKSDCEASLSLKVKKKCHEAEAEKEKEDDEAERDEGENSELEDFPSVDAFVRRKRGISAEKEVEHMGGTPGQGESSSLNLLATMDNLSNRSVSSLADADALSLDAPQVAGPSTSKGKRSKQDRKTSALTELYLAERGEMEMAYRQEIQEKRRAILRKEEAAAELYMQQLTERHEKEMSILRKKEEMTNIELRTAKLREEIAKKELEKLS